MDFVTGAPRRGFETGCASPLMVSEPLRRFSRYTLQSFHFDTEDTEPAYTQMQIQHRSRAPGPPYNSRTPHPKEPTRPKSHQGAFGVSIFKRWIRSLSRSTLPRSPY